MPRADRQQRRAQECGRPPNQPLQGIPEIELCLRASSATAGEAKPVHLVVDFGNSRTGALLIEMAGEVSQSAEMTPFELVNRLLRKQAEGVKTATTVYPFDNVMPQPVIDLFYRVNATVFTGAQTAEDAVAQLQAEFERQG